MLLAMILTGCSNNSKSLWQNASPKNTKLQDKVQRSTPEETVKSYYENEVNKNAKFLSSYFINPTVSETNSIKTKLNAFDVGKVEIIKLFNIKNQGNYAVIICAYNTYFKEINTSRPDIEVVSLVNKNGLWYILNDYGNISEKDMDWLNTAVYEENQFIKENSEIQSIIGENKNFDKANNAFILKSQEKMKNMQTSNEAF